MCNRENDQKIKIKKKNVRGRGTESLRRPFFPHALSTPSAKMPEVPSVSLALGKEVRKEGQGEKSRPFGHSLCGGGG